MVVEQTYNISNSRFSSQGSKQNCGKSILHNPTLRTDLQKEKLHCANCVFVGVLPDLHNSFSESGAETMQTTCTNK